jgi:hypothetical protein
LGGKVPVSKIRLTSNDGTVASLFSYIYNYIYISMNISSYNFGWVKTLLSGEDFTLDQSLEGINLRIG